MVLAYAGVGQDLTRLETGNETSFNEPFDLPATISEAVQLYRYIGSDLDSSMLI